MRTLNSRRPAVRLLCAAALSCLLLSGNSPTAQAAFYKCVGDNGSTTYNDTPCAADESTHLLSKSARQLEGLDCRIARNFAFDAIARMRQNESATDVFEVYGGATSLSDDARSLIDYVYTFQGNRLTSAQRIVDLTIERCQAGLLGKALDQCDAFPGQFIDRFGSCIDARQTEQTLLIQPAVGDGLSSNSAGDSDVPDAPVLNAAQPASDTESAAEQRTSSTASKPDRKNADSIDVQ